MDDTLRAEAKRDWFGYGRWDAPYWFVGMEPGDEDHPEIYTAWDAAGRTPLIDAKRHEDEWNSRVGDSRKTHWFADKPKIQKATWQPLIHILLGFKGSDEDPHEYQRGKFGRTDGETAVLEVSAIAYKSTASVGERGLSSERNTTIRQYLQKPGHQLAVFYGLTYVELYAEIAGGPFDENGHRWSGDALCALIPHPARPTKKYVYWSDYGRSLREVYDRGR